MARKRVHGIETILVQVKNHIIISTDLGRIVLLVRLDLSDQFDTADNYISSSQLRMFVSRIK